MAAEETEEVAAKAAELTGEARAPAAQAGEGTAATVAAEETEEVAAKVYM